MLASRHATQSAACPRHAAPAHLVLFPPVTPCQHHTDGTCTQQRRQHRQRLRPCRVTNTSDEIYRAMKVKVPDGDPEEFVYVDEMQVHYPELGPLENRIGKQYLQEMFNDSGVDLEETAYWFHTPPGGWQSEPVAYVAAPEAPVTFPEPEHLDAEHRTLLEDVEEGQVITGVITDCWLYHGIQVDFGAQFDGLVPIPQDIWMEDGVRETFLPGAIITATIHKVRMPGLYRWPVQLQLLEPSWVASLLPDPDSYHAPIDHGWCAEQGWEPQDICAATGRHFEPPTYLLPDDDESEMEAMEAAFAYDDPDNSRYYTNPYTEWDETIGQERVYELLNDLT